MLYFWRRWCQAFEWPWTMVFSYKRFNTIFFIFTDRMKGYNDDIETPQVMNPALNFAGDKHLNPKKIILLKFWSDTNSLRLRLCSCCTKQVCIRLITIRQRSYGKVMFPVVSACLSTGWGSLCDHTWNCSNLFTWEHPQPWPLLPAIQVPWQCNLVCSTWISPHSELPKVAGKWAVGLPLKDLLVELIVWT